MLFSHTTKLQQWYTHALLEKNLGFYSTKTSCIMYVLLFYIRYKLVAVFYQLIVILSVLFFSRPFQASQDTTSWQRLWRLLVY